MSNSQAVDRITCLYCGSSNPDDRDFCSECGKSLWQDCPSCGHRQPVSVNFCGKCGENIRDIRDQEAADVEKKVALVRELEADGKFNEALKLCKSLKLLSKDRFADAIQFAEERSGVLESQQQSAEERAMALLEQAKGLLVEHQFEPALKRLKAIDSALRTEEVDGLIKATSRNVEEIARLKTRIQKLIKQRPLEAFGDIASLLRLQPNELKVKKLGEQLRGQIVKRVHAKVDGQLYAEANKLLTAVPAEFKTQDIEELSQRCETVLWYEEYLRTSPFVDENLIGCAKQFARVAEKNKNSGPWLKQAEVRFKEAQQKPTGVMPWASSKQPPAIGASVQFLQPIQGFKLEAKKVPGGAASLQRFSVAIGLALQAIGKGAFDSCFGKGGKKGLISKLGFKGGKSPDTAWGIDIGVTGVKAVELKKTGEDIAITDIRFIEIEKAAPQTRTEIETRELLRGALVKLRDDADLKGKPALFSVDSSQILARFISFPSVDEKKLGSMVELEAKHGIPFPIEDVDWYWNRFATKADGSVPILVLAARRDDIDDRMTVLKQLEFNVIGVQSNAVALFHLARHQNTADETADSFKPVIMFDFGAEATQMVVANHERLWFRTLSHGGSKQSLAIGRCMKLSFVDAEQVKMQPFAEDNALTVSRCLSKPLTELFNEIDRSRVAARKEGFDTDHAEVLVTGGASRTLDLCRTLLHGPSSESQEAGIQ